MIVRLADVSKIREGRASGEIQRINQRQIYLVLGSLERGARLFTPDSDDHDYNGSWCFSISSRWRRWRRVLATPWHCDFLWFSPCDSSDIVPNSLLLCPDP